MCVGPLEWPPFFLISCNYVYEIRGNKLGEWLLRYINSLRKQAPADQDLPLICFFFFFYTPGER